MRSPRFRRAPAGARRARREPLTSSAVHSSHLATTRVGPITLWVSPRGARRIEFGPLPRGRAGDPPDAWPELLKEAVAQIEAYLARDRRDFDLPLDFPESTSPFQ